jgi:hypothetical protein
MIKVKLKTGNFTKAFTVKLTVSFTNKNIFLKIKRPAPVLKSIINQYRIHFALDIGKPMRSRIGTLFVLQHLVFALCTLLR